MARAALAAACAVLLAAAAAGYAPGVCQDACGASRPFSDPNSLPGEVCADTGPCGALVYPARSVAEGCRASARLYRLLV